MKGVPMADQKPRRTYTREFKLEAVRQVVDAGRRPTEVARSLGIDRSLLSNWRRNFEEEGVIPRRGDPAASGISLEEENRRLRQELANAKHDLEFLKKAAAYFAKNSD